MMADAATTPIARTRWSSDDPADLFAVENPATGKTLALVQGVDADGVDRAVRAADAAFEADWRWRPARERGALLLACAAKLRAHADELAELETRENGKPLTQSRPFDIEALIGSFDFFGALIDKLPGDFFDLGAIHNVVRTEPFGVVAGVIPFNWPPIHTGAKAAPALAAGNTVVLKPGEQAPLTIIRIVELLNEVLPPDVLHVVPGTGARAGAALVAHPLVRKISFTGSTGTGASVLRTAADRIVPALVELGGKNAFLVFADADIEAAVAGALEGGFFNQGEACTAASRLLVHASIHDVFVEKLAAAVRRLRVGDGFDPATHVGPLVTGAHRDRVQRFIETGVAEGARIAAQAAMPSDPVLAGGFFVPPTLFVDVDPSMTIAREEIFGPVVAVIRFETVDEAIAIANDSDFGLVAGIWSRDSALCQRVARRLDVGVVFINNYNRSIIGTPFGGAKMSGYGREHAIQTLKEFGRAKAVRSPSGEGAVPRWSAVDELLPSRETK